MSRDAPAHLRIPFVDIEKATNFFAKENLLKQDAMTDVYKGVLILRSKLEIDVVIWRYRDPVDVVYEEMRVNCGIRNTNIVSFIGICDERNERIIVMEHALNGSLDKYLSDPTTLSWSQRLHICYGAALALNYWKDCDATLKDNVRGFKLFVDKDWKAKLFFVIDWFQPQYRYETKSSSLGMIMLEVLYGKIVTNEDVNQYRVKMAKQYYEEAELDDHLNLIDPNLRKQMHPKSLSIFLETAYDWLTEPNLLSEIDPNIIPEKVFYISDGWDAQQNQYTALEHILKRLKEAFDIQWKHENLVSTFMHLCFDQHIFFVNFDLSYSYMEYYYRDVYSAELELDELPKKQVIIERLTKSNITSQELYADIEMHSTCNHPNLIPLLGFCDEDSEMILVFEYEIKYHLHNFENEAWEKKVRICLDVAYGLKYLRDKMIGKPCMMGERIRSANIFIDANQSVKIANFKVWEHYKKSTLWQSGPENFRFWLLDQRLVADHIYSFGVVLFEVLTGDGRESFYTTIEEEEFKNSSRRPYLGQPHYDEALLKSTLVYRRKYGAEITLDILSTITYQCLTTDTRSEHPTLEVVIKSLEKALYIQSLCSQVQNLVQKVPLQDIKLATLNFDTKHLIGSGGYGDVYQAKLKMENEDEHCDTPKSVAIKRITSRIDIERYEAFFDELIVASKCKHPNIVSLLGFSVEEGEMLLVYELASNGSLEGYLETKDKVINLSWAQRLKMCIDIAQGLEHMHTAMEDKERIIHRDIKSANILLGKNWEAKIADFGLSKVHNSDQGVSTIKTIHVAGTPFYVDPEYAKTGRLKRASDIYSLGVVLFEIFSGKLAYDQTYKEENNKGLAPIAQRHFENNTINKILDSKMVDEASELGLTLKVRPDQDSVDAFSNIAYRCLASSQDKRPTIEDVIDHLKKALQLQENRMKPLKISLEQIRSSVENFSENKCIRSGGYGMSYKGTIQDNDRHKEVVVKRFTSQEHAFLKEFEVLFKHKHENIVGFAGYCKEMDEKIIVYDHAPKGSLDRYMKDTDLSWTKRLKICIDIAKGLKFLHEGDIGQDVVIHRDLKSSNILLTDDWKAKICGFEHALTYPTNQETEYVIDSFEGSHGYSDPLFQKTRTLTKESDIYSFGVILFEILCGRLACPQDEGDEGPLLDVLVKSQYEGLENLVFEGIKKHVVLKSFSTFRKIAFQCLQEKREERPAAVDVVVQLKQALEYQEAYEIRKAKLDRTNEELLHELSSCPEINSTMRKTKIYNILSKGFLFEDDKPLP